jgi:hypothetical protein
MGANAKQVRIPVASRKQSRRPTDSRKPVLTRAARQTRQRPKWALRRLVLTRAPRRPPMRADLALRRLVLTCVPMRLPLRADLALPKRRRTELQVSARPQQTPRRAGRRKHRVRPAASRTQRQPTAGLRKPQTMRHHSVRPALAPRRCKAPSATAPSERFSKSPRSSAQAARLHNRACNHNFVAFRLLTLARLI